MGGEGINNFSVLRFGVLAKVLWQMMEGMNNLGNLCITEGCCCSEGRLRAARLCLAPSAVGVQRD